MKLEHQMCIIPCCNTSREQTSLN